MFGKATRQFHGEKNNFMPVVMGKLSIHRPKNKVSPSVAHYRMDALSGLSIHFRIRIETVVL